MNGNYRRSVTPQGIRALADRIAREPCSSARKAVVDDLHALADWLEATRTAPAPDTWDEADYRRDGDQALTALADSIRKQADRQEEK